jgi:hypothetical protein
MHETYQMYVMGTIAQELGQRLTIDLASKSEIEHHGVPDW